MIYCNSSPKGELLHILLYHYGYRGNNMLFNSYIFVLLFLPVTVAVYHLINKSGRFSAAKIFLLAMSFWFYCYSEPENVIVLLLSIVINYAISTFAFTEERPEKAKKVFLTLGIIINIAALLYFKYTGFFSDILNDLFKTSFDFKAILVPLGVSFFTFGQIAYLVDSYRAPLEKYSLLDYSLFVVFFPKISVGPIAFAKEMIPQFNDSLKKSADQDNIAKGLYMFVLGLAKKVIIADNLGVMVDWCYQNTNIMDTFLALMMTVGYTMQIYFDFSGYCDMASGICKMLNFELPVNFDSPYRSLSIDEFWKKWHMSLTRFFRQYVYFPLGGNRKGKVRTYLNIFLIFLLSGLWHGANYTFILWGVIHGVGMCLSKAFGKYTKKLPAAIRFIFTFIYINLTWVFFRARTVTEAISVIKTLFSLSFNTLDKNTNFVVSVMPAEFELFQWLLSLNHPELTKLSGLIVTILIVLTASLISVLAKNPQERIKAFRPNRRLLAGTVILLVWSVISLSNISTFIYTNF